MNGNINNNLDSFESENTIASLLLHLSDNYIFDTIEQNIQNRVTFYPVQNPNIVYSIRQKFHNIEANYQLDQSAYNEINNTYARIIDLLCRSFNITLNARDNLDIYTTAYFLYEFLVSDYQKRMTNFFVQFIISEKDNLYRSMNLNDVKKNKDTSTLYCKKVIADPKIAIISANLESVLNNMIGFDISIEHILYYAYNDNAILYNYLKDLINPNGDFFKEQYGSFLCSDKKPTIITNIRMELQKACGVVDSDLINIEDYKGDQQ